MVETEESVAQTVVVTALTFTIGWLKPSVVATFIPQRLTLTFTIGWLKLGLCTNMEYAYSFNFHHRVVETKGTGDVQLITTNFNFHHRVVETARSSNVSSVSSL